MKTILETDNRDELERRISSANDNASPQWGKMTVGQIVKRFTMWDEMAQLKANYKQSLLGKIFGKMALKDMLIDKPLKRNLPTVHAFKITGNPNFKDEKIKWLKLMANYAQLLGKGFLHPFFGQLTKEQTGIIAYKQIDHRLRQFHA